MTLDSFVALLSDTAWKLVPVAVVILLIYLIVVLPLSIVAASSFRVLSSTALPSASYSCASM